VTDRPIIFSAPMVRALLDGRKTQTRRVLKPQPVQENGLWWWHPSKYWGAASNVYQHGDAWRSYPGFPYAVGDRLWVRESIGRRPASFLGIEAKNGVESAFYAADGEDVVEQAGFNICPWWPQMRSLPPIHMPRWASRLTLTVTDVRVQRVQDISEGDARAEGARHFPDLPLATPTARPNRWSMEEPKNTDDALSSARWAFANYWIKLHGRNEHDFSAWDANPWVVALTFTVERRNIDAAHP